MGEAIQNQNDECQDIGYKNYENDMVMKSLLEDLGLTKSDDEVNTIGNLRKLLIGEILAHTSKQVQYNVAYVNNLSPRENYTSSERGGMNSIQEETIINNKWQKDHHSNISYY